MNTTVGSSEWGVAARPSLASPLPTIHSSLSC
jgi:hypothetical protein